MAGLQSLGISGIHFSWGLDSGGGAAGGSRLLSKRYKVPQDRAVAAGGDEPRVVQWQGCRTGKAITAKYVNMAMRPGESGKGLRLSGRYRRPSGAQELDSPCGNRRTTLGPLPLAVFGQARGAKIVTRAEEPSQVPVRHTRARLQAYSRALQAGVRTHPAAPLLTSAFTDPRASRETPFPPPRKQVFRPPWSTGHPSPQVNQDRTAGDRPAHVCRIPSAARHICPPRPVTQARLCWEEAT